MDTLTIFSFLKKTDPALLQLLTFYQARWHFIHRHKEIIAKEEHIQKYRNGGIHLFLIDSSRIDSPDYLKKINDLLKHTAINICIILNNNTQLKNTFLNQFHDFIIWPCCNEEFKARIQRYQSDKALHHNNEKTLEEFAKLNLAGQSTRFIEAVNLIKKVSECDAPLLIRGETGTGKENAARAVHYLGKRANYGFVPINCGAIPDELLENELFGHNKGAFTDAKSSQKGLVEIAEGGTLFLDEIDSLSLKAQAALLRFLQSLEYRALGASHTSKANVRIIVASNADLPQRIAQGYFREDLYFRINVLSIYMPSLRERQEDIELLAKRFIGQFNHHYNTAPKRLSPQSLQWLQQQPWPGNVRELENCLLREFLLTDGCVIHINHAEPPPLPITQSTATEEDELPRFQTAKADAVRKFERSYLSEVLQLTQGNVSEAARIAGKERRALGKLIKKYAIDKASFA